MSVLIETSHGSLTVDLSLARSPSTVAAFLKSLASQALTEQSLVRLEPDFCAVFAFRDRLILPEQDPHPTRFDAVGMVGLDATGIVITLAPRIASFDRKFRLLGRLAGDSEATMRKIGEVVVDSEGRPLVEGSTPVIRAVFVLDDPLKAVGDVDEFNGEAVTEAARQETIRRAQGEARRRHTESRTRDKTRFVARLNKVTEEADLRVIFGKFGEVERLNVVKDEESGESLGYGFVEFADKRTCEKTLAEIKSRGLEIDSRKIFVDFAHGVR